MLCDSESSNRWPSERNSVSSCFDFSVMSMTSPSKLSPSAIVGAWLLTLALSSPSLVALDDKLGSKLRGFEHADEVESSRDSLPKACVLVTESCVVAFETSWGRDGALVTKCDGARVTECDDTGRDVKLGMSS